MKQVNFKELSVETSIEHFESLDLRQQIGNAIHSRAVNVPMAELARKVYYAEEAIIIEDGDFKQMLSIVEQAFPLVVSSAILKSAIEVTDAKDKCVQ